METVSYLLSTARKETSIFEHIAQLHTEDPTLKLSPHGKDTVTWKIEVASAAAVLAKCWAMPELMVRNAEDDDLCSRKDFSSGNDDAPPTSAPADPAKTSLLTLPPEMRNRIYRFALVETQEIFIKASEKPPNHPPLICTCRQIWYECANIYYQENKFTFDIDNNDASRLFGWCTTSLTPLMPTAAFQTELSAKWKNLLNWLQAFFEKRCLGVAPVGDGDKRDVIGHMFRVVQTMQNDGVSWPQVNHALMDMRNVLALLDPRWLEEAA